MTTKTELRRLAKSKRKIFDTKQSSEKIIRLISSWNKYQDAGNILIYYPINNEISLLDLPGDKNFYLPRLINDEICVCPVNGADLRIGKFDIPEPDSEPVPDLKILDIAFIPALAADRWGYRIGYGCGYYDRFLPHLDKITIKIIPIYDELLFENIPFQAHDEKADFVVTENELFSTSVRIAQE